MSIERFYTTTATVKRLTWSNDSSALVTQDTVSGHLQQVNADLTQRLGFKFGELYYLWCALDSDIERSDRIEIGSNTYEVQDVKELLEGRNTHLRVTLFKNNIE